MMKFPLRLLGSLFLLASLQACRSGPPEISPVSTPAASTTTLVHAGALARQPTPLLLISIDGFRADYLQRGLSPTLDMLAQRGVLAAAGMQPAFPSLTFPNHYTLVTGLTPDHHGIVSNDMQDPALGRFAIKNRAATSDGRWWSGGTPLWETADQHGLRTATMFWPGSDADIHGTRPDAWQPFNASVTPDARVDQVLQWLTQPEPQRPSFVTLYFDAVDHAGHLYGPNTPEVNQAIEQTDAALAHLVAGLKKQGLFDSINIIVVADHGMVGVPPQNNVFIDDRLPLDQVQTVELGVLGAFNPKPGFDFGPLEARLTHPANQGHMQCWDKRDIPARFAYGHNARVPQLVCLADVGWRITTHARADDRAKPLSLGEHGYDNADPHMRALFLAEGPAFRQGLRFPSFPNVDVYPLMAHLLGIPALPNDGHYEQVAPMLKAAN